MSVRAKTEEGTRVVKTYIGEGEQPESQIGATLEALAATIADRRGAGEESYTYRLLSGPADKLLKKVMEEAGEVALAAKEVDMLANAPANVRTLDSSAEPDAMGAQRHAGGMRADWEPELDHLRYESADLVYHLLVVLERFGIGIEEFAGELNTRMSEAERPAGAVMIVEEHINRG